MPVAVHPVVGHRTRAYSEAPAAAVEQVHKAAVVEALVADPLVAAQPVEVRVAAVLQVAEPKVAAVPKVGAEPKAAELRVVAPQEAEHPVAAAAVR